MNSSFKLSFYLYHIFGIFQRKNIGVSSPFIFGLNCAIILKMKILITAGATWIKIDAVRILTNRFTGKSGVFLAKALKRKGHAVTLLVNPHCIGRVTGVSAVYYRYFAEFKSKIIKILKSRRFDVIVHMAAISDYKLKGVYPGKIPSGRAALNLKLIPAEKIITKIRKLSPKSTLIQFKLEAGRKGLADKAYQSLLKNQSDFVVANCLEDMRLGYKALLIDRRKKITRISSKKALAQVLNRLIIK